MDTVARLFSFCSSCPERICYPFFFTNKRIGMTRSFEMTKVSSAVFVREKKGKEKREG